MRPAHLRDLSAISSLLATHKKVLMPCPSDKSVRQAILAKEAYYDKGVFVLLKQHTSKYKRGHIIINPPCTEVKVIASKYKGRGYAKEMMLWVINTYKHVCLEVYSNNVLANELYRKLGMAMVGKELWSSGETTYYEYKRD